MSKIHKPRASRANHPRTNLPVLTTEQLNKIIEASASYLRHPATASVIRLLAHTGFRLEELVELKISDVDAANGRIRVSSKYGDSVRYIPLDPEALKAIESLHADNTSSEYVLGDSAQKLMDRASRQFRELTNLLRMKPYSIHSLRQHFAVGLAASGMDVARLKYFLGHCRISTTIRYYSDSTQ